MSQKLLAKIEAANAITKPKILRFSECDLRGHCGAMHKGYRWQAVTTDKPAIMEALCAMWNERELIADLLRKG